MGVVSRGGGLGREEEGGENDCRGANEKTTKNNNNNECEKLGLNARPDYRIPSRRGNRGRGAPCPIASPSWPQCLEQFSQKAF